MYQQRIWDFFPVGECFRKQYEEELTRAWWTGTLWKRTEDDDISKHCWLWLTYAERRNWHCRLYHQVLRVCSHEFPACVKIRPIARCLKLFRRDDFAVFFLWFKVCTYVWCDFLLSATFNFFFFKLCFIARAVQSVAFFHRN